MQEEWKPIPSLDGIYEASNLGNIRSIRFNKVLVLKTRESRRGYVHVDISFNKTKYTKQVHVLIAEAFFDHKPNNKFYVVDHINNIKNDNTLSNLQIISQRENASKDRKNKTSKYIGVHWSTMKKRWISSIFIDGKTKRLGSFKCELAAYYRYKCELERITS